MKIVALVSYKYDEDYVQDLKLNLKGIADEIVVNFDADGSFWKDEGQYRIDMIKRAEDLGADYVLVIDPDERLERRAKTRIRKLINQYHGQKVLFEFNFRELYTPLKYRTDGIWGEKKRIVLFPLLKDNIYSTVKLHTPRHPINDDFQVINTGLDMYHLKHIKPELRKSRKDIYNALDPERKFNAPGYDYLDDEEGMVLKRILPLRTYQPRYRDYKIDEAMFEVAKKK